MAERRSLPAAEVVAIGLQLVSQVQALHDAGIIHRAIEPGSVSIDDQENVRLRDPAAEAAMDVDNGDTDRFPPEFRNACAIQLPCSISAATRVLKGAGISADPRRIDLYQLGCLLCRISSGQSLSDYLRSPRAMAGVPLKLRPIIDKAIGLDANNRYRTCRELHSALEGSLDGQKSETVSGRFCFSAKLSRACISKVPYWHLRSRAMFLPM
jgi:serine/threonine protein kinase